MTSDLGVGVGRWHTCLGNSKASIWKRWHFQSTVWTRWLSLPLAGFPRKGILWLGPRYPCWPQLFTPFTSAQICWRLIWNNTQTKVPARLISPSAMPSAWLRGGPTAPSHRFSVRVLPQIAVAVTRRGYADVVLVRAVASQTTVTTGAIVMDRLEGRHSQ